MELNHPWSLIRRPGTTGAQRGCAPSESNRDLPGLSRLSLPVGVGAQTHGVAPARGFEPRYAVSKTAVLPLDDTGIEVISKNRKCAGVPGSRPRQDSNLETAAFGKPWQSFCTRANLVGAPRRIRTSTNLAS